MDQEARLIRFSDGTMIVCMIEDVDDIQKKSFIDITYPIQVVSGGLESLEETRAMEQYSLKAWMGLSDDFQFTINAKDITVISNLREEYVVGYENVVNRLYFTNEDLHGTVPEDELSPEDLLEYLQLKDKGKLN
jgi:hypothetical protein